MAQPRVKTSSRLPELLSTTYGSTKCRRPSSPASVVTFEAERSVAEASRQRRPMRRFRGRPCVCAIIARQSAPLPAPPRNGRRSTSELPTMPLCSLRSFWEKVRSYSGRRGLRRTHVFVSCNAAKTTTAVWPKTANTNTSKTSHLTVI